MRIYKVIFVVILVNLVLAPAVMAAADPYYYKQWYLSAIKAQDAWNETKGSNSVVVAVLDTGVDWNHPDLVDNLWTNTGEIADDGIDNDGNGFIDDIHGWDFVNKRADINAKIVSGYSVEAASHGTFVAGLISAIHSNGTGIKGITDSVKIMPVTVLDTSGNGSSKAVTKGINYAVANGADIVNLSFGGDEYHAGLLSSITEAYNKGVLVVAAAGNAINGNNIGADLAESPLYPICYDKVFSVNRVLGVMASDKNSAVASFSNYGTDCIDIAAPGEDMVSLLFQDEKYSNLKLLYGEGWSGTSFSTALVSGAVALLKSKDSSATPAQLITAITENSGLLVATNSKHKGKIGAGLLNIKKALSSLTASSSTPVSKAPIKTPVSSSVPNAVNTPSPIATVKNSSLIYAAGQTDRDGNITVFDSQFNKIDEIEVFGSVKYKGVNFQLKDVDGDGQDDVVAGAVAGNTPFVRVLELDGTLKTSFIAFENNFSGGANVSAGDVDGDGEVEIVVVPQSGREPIVRVYSQNGKKEYEFFAYNRNYTGGLNVEVGDVDGDGQAEIITAPRNGLMPKVKIFEGAGTLQKSLTVYAASFTGGVNLALGDMDNNGVLDLITGAGFGGGPHVKAFNYAGAELLDFFAYGSSFRGGVKVSAFDFDKDGKTDILTGVGPTGAPHVRIYNKFKKLLGEKFVFAAEFVSGINIGGR